MLDVLTKADYFALLDSGFGDPTVVTLRAAQEAWGLSVLHEREPVSRIVEFGVGPSGVLTKLAARGHACSWMCPASDGVVADLVPLGGNVPDSFGGHPGGRTDLPLKDASVDCFLSLSVLEHLELMSLKHLFCEMRRCLTPGGLAMHAVNVILGDDPLPRTGEVISALVDGVTESGLTWLVTPRTDPATCLASVHLTEPAAYLWRYWRASAALEQLVLRHQVCSLRLACTNEIKATPSSTLSR